MSLHMYSTYTERNPIHVTESGQPGFFLCRTFQLSDYSQLCNYYGHLNADTQLTVTSKTLGAFR